MDDQALLIELIGTASRRLSVRREADLPYIYRKARETVGEQGQLTMDRVVDRPLQIRSPKRSQPCCSADGYLEYEYIRGTLKQLDASDLTLYVVRHWNDYTPGRQPCYPISLQARHATLGMPILDNLLIPIRETFMFCYVVP